MDAPPQIAALPRFTLLDGPSALQPLARLSAALGGGADLWIKRDDLLPLAFGGNKLRNLEFLVGAALAEGADTLVTSGRRWSNHCRLTAAAGARAGLAVHLVLSGPPSGPPGPNRRLLELLGATVHVAAGAERAEREALVARVAADIRDAGGHPYVVGVGGGGVVGVLGQVLAGLELASQAGDRGLDPAVVVLPSATGATQAGLVAGLGLARSRARVVGVAVAQPPATLRSAIVDLLDALGRFLPIETDPAAVEIDDGQIGDGYGVASAAADEATALLARTEGLLVDPIYTAKALAGLVARVRSGELDGRPAVFWHAGGLPGLFEPLDPVAPRAVPAVDAAAPGTESGPGG